MNEQQLTQALDTAEYLGIALAYDIRANDEIVEDAIAHIQALVARVKELEEKK